MDLDFAAWCALAGWTSLTLAVATTDAGNASVKIEEIIAKFETFII
jgi:hypothetical protein